MSLTQADLDAIFKSNQDQYNNTVAIMEAVQTYGTIDEFITQSDKWVTRLELASCLQNRGL
jgi:hypothetical protein